jgi:hypothetical protein
MITLETVLAVSLSNPTVMAELGDALKDDLVTSNPFQRRIVQFASEFLAERRKLPSDGDYSVWLETLPEGNIRDGSREALGRLLAVNTSSYDPAYFAEVAIEQLRRGAAQVARARLNETTILEPEAFDVLARKIDSLTRRADGRGTLFPTLGQLLDPPTGAEEEVEAVPHQMIPRLAWSGRHVLLVGAEKLGKSTFAAAGVAALTRTAHFLHERAATATGAPGRVLWLGMDEARGDAYGRLLDNGARRTHVVVHDPAKPSAFLRGVIEEERRPDVVVIDSLIEYARRETREPLSSGDASGWGRVIRPLTRMAHDHGVAVVTIHHARKSDGRYRDSTEIAAGVDAILTMREPSANQPPEVRRMSIEGRRSITRGRGDYAVRLERQEVPAPVPEDMQATVLREYYELWAGGDGFGGVVPASEGPTVRAKLTGFIQAHPGSSTNEVLAGVGGNRNAASAALKDLTDEGVIRVEERAGRGGGKRHYIDPEPAGGEPGGTSIIPGNASVVGDNTRSTGTDPEPAEGGV